MTDPLDIPEPDEPDEEVTHPGKPYIAVMVVGKPDPYVFSLKDWHYVWNDGGLSVVNDHTRPTSTLPAAQSNTVSTRQ